MNALAASVRPAPLDGGPHGPEDVAWLLYTGGTTGVPKAAMLPERALAQLVMSVLTGWDLPKHMRYLACAPISHAAGMLIAPTLLTGGTVVLQPSFDPGRWLSAVVVALAAPAQAEFGDLVATLQASNSGGLFGFSVSMSGNVGVSTVVGVLFISRSLLYASEHAS